MDDVNISAPREPYEPPAIEDIPLRAEEQILAGCKLFRSGGPNATFCGGGGGRPCTAPQNS